MELVLGPLEARVIGALIEKEICTPDQYPLSLNALVNACNQKSNREPVLELCELDIRAVVDELIRKRLVVNTAGFNARVPRYQHRFCNTEFGTLKFSAQELGIVCELLLRGPQTPGELRSRTNRLCRFDDVTQVDAALAALIEQGPYVVKLPREPGKRESRYAHLFSGEVDLQALAEASPASSYASPAVDRLSALEAEVETLKAQLQALEARLAQLEG
ncbi:MAG: YceH family protein [Aeromonas popoffii]|uniref:YceH family protein n=1 Tax=Aeromonas popoffii TaxID=70856 RepID=UPI003F304DC3